MKPLYFLYLLPVIVLVIGCGAGEQAATTQGGGYLDSTYVSKTYRAAMDSIHNSSGISEEDFKELQGFMRDYREEIKGTPTYRSLLESAKGIASMENGIGLQVESLNLHTVQKNVEVRFVLSFENKLSKAIGKFRANIGWLDAEGKHVATTPSFSVVGPIPAGQSISHLRLEYPMYKATGNELNDPKLQALRDTLEVIEEVYKHKDLKAFTLRIQDLQMANGLNPAKYWMMTESERAQLQDLPAVKTSDRMPLLKWADKNETWIDKLKATNSPYSLLLSPVITERVEVSNGKNLILDRVAKVFAFFNEQKQIPRANINAATKGKTLELEEIIDFWNWPMEIRIYGAE